MRLSIDSLQHLQDYFSSPRANSRCLPSIASSRRRLLGLRRRSFRTPGCRSGVDLDNLGAKKDYEEMLAKKSEGLAQTKTRWSSDLSQLSRAKTCAGWAPHWLQSHAQPARWINFGSFCESVPQQILLLRLPVIPGAATGTQLDKKIRSVPHVLQPPVINKEPESNAKMYVNQRRGEMART